MKKAEIIKILNNYRTVTDVIQWVEFDSIATDIISEQLKECDCGGYPDCICEEPSKQNQSIVNKAMELASKKCGKKERAMFPKPTDEDIINASQDYVSDTRASLPTEVAQAYQTGAKEMRDKQIYISEIDNRTRPLIPSPQQQVSEAINYLNKYIVVNPHKLS